MLKRFNYEEITKRALAYLKDHLSYKYRTLYRYRTYWQHLKSYADSRNIGWLTPHLCNAFLINLYNGRNRNDLSVNEKAIEKCVSVLCEFMQTGTVQKTIKIRHLDDPAGTAIKDFLQDKVLRILSHLTIDKAESHLSAFNFWLASNNVFYLKDIFPKHIIGFIQQLNPAKRALIHDTLRDLRNFLDFAYHKGYISSNLASSVPCDNYKHQSRLPSYYNSNELKQLMASINRATKVGKRDYALLMLAMHLGLRASDIARLKFENIHWDKNIITLAQYKTGKGITLPLLPPVGNAILDYIQYARPQSTEPFIFLLMTWPYSPIKGSTIANMAGRRFTSAGINIKDKRHGSHSLRHSLVKELMDHKQPIPVIVEVMGHNSMEATRHYIRIDTEQLRRCTLSVPPVAKEFYSQEKISCFSNS